MELWEILISLLAAKLHYERFGTRYGNILSDVSYLYGLGLVYFHFDHLHRSVGEGLHRSVGEGLQGSVEEGLHGSGGGASWVSRGGVV